MDKDFVKKCEQRRENPEVIYDFKDNMIGRGAYGRVFKAIPKRRCVAESAQRFQVSAMITFKTTPNRHEVTQ